jgi:hypothetical protein
MAVSDYSTTPGDNTSISGLAVSDATVVNTWDNIIRQLMADIRTADNQNVKLTGDQTLDGAKTFTTSLITQSASTTEIRMKSSGTASTHNTQSFAHGLNIYVQRTMADDGTVVANDYIKNINSSGATDHAWRVADTARLLVNSSGITVTGSVTEVSDARVKSDIADLTEVERKAAAKIKARTFVTEGQKHVGYIAQEIIEAMKSEGLCAFEYGLVKDADLYSVDYNAVNAFRLG